MLLNILYKSNGNEWKHIVSVVRKIQQTKILASEERNRID